MYLLATCMPFRRCEFSLDMIKKYAPNFGPNPKEDFLLVIVVKEKA